MKEAYQWREYTLYNPAEGFAYLSEYNGHWIFLKEMADAPVVTSNKTLAYQYDGKTFKKYNQYQFNLVDSLGEFPGEVLTLIKISPTVLSTLLRPKYGYGKSMNGLRGCAGIMVRT